MQNMFCILAVALLLPLCARAAVMMDIAGGTERCIGQHLDLEDAATFEMSLQSGAKAVRATLFFPSSGGTPAETIALSLGETKAVEVNVAENGVFKMCFHASERGPAARVAYAVLINSKTPEKSLTKADGSADNTALEAQIKAVEKKLFDIKREMDFARRQEELDEDEKTLFKVQVFGAVSIVILVVTSVWQVYYLRSFFVSKKLL